MASVQELLTLQALQDQQPATPEEQAWMTAAGAGAGMLLSSPVHAAAKSLENRAIRRADREMLAQNAVPTRKQATIDSLRRFRPGVRMAGVVGLGMLAGQFGPALKREAMGSPAAQMLGRLQSGQELSPSDQEALANLLTQAYENQVGYGVA